MPPAKPRFAPVGDCIPDRNDPPPRQQRTESKNQHPPSHCHRGIFISPQRNENIRDLRRTAGMTPHRNPAPQSSHIQKKL